MKSGRMLWVILFGIPALLMVPVVLIGSSVFQAGTIEFEVVEKGPHGSSVSAIVPASVIPIALALTPNDLLDEVRCEVDGEAAYALEIAKVAWKELARCPDGVFVEVLDGEDYVTIEKRGGEMLVFVDTPSETVRLSVPLHTVTSLLTSI